MILHELLVPTYGNMLRALSGMIDKAAAHGSDAMLEDRLAEDMFPLAQQFRFAANMPGEALARLAGVEFTSRDANPTSFAEAKDWLAHSLAVVEGVGSGDFRPAEESFDLALPNGMTFHLTAEQYARDWALPNFYFHVNTAYAIMRKNGVQLGKSDLIPHMGAYFKPGG